MKKIKIKFIYLLSLIILPLACAKKATSSSSGQKYEEDLSAYRPKYEIKETPKNAPNKAVAYPEPREHQNQAVEENLSLIREKNKGIKYTQGYRIQVYSGSDKDAAEKAKEGIYRLNLDHEPEITYFPPNFKVKVGQFYDRVEAHETLLKVKKSFPTALLLPEKVNIK